MLGDAHFLQAALDHPGARGMLLHFFQVQAVHDFFHLADQISHEERLGNKVLDPAANGRAQLFLNVAAAGDEHGNGISFGGPRGRANFLKELPPVQALAYGNRR